jgi:GNAT superfamily N-acetyltransferase
MTGIQVRAATQADGPAIGQVAVATGQDEEWSGSDPAYVAWLLATGRLLVAVQRGAVAGFGATRRIGAGPAAVSMLCDLFVHPDAHGLGIGQAVLAELWRDAPRRMTFSSLHAHALPLYTRFGVDAWWPLLYLAGPVARLRGPAAGGPAGLAGWAAGPSDVDQVAAAELGWTGVDRSADHRAWAARPCGQPAEVRRDGALVAAGTVAGHGDEYGIVHLAVAPELTDDGARDAVLTLLASLDAPGGRARVCLPAPHPAVRPLLEAGWRVTDQDLYMASDPGLLDARRAVPSPSAA